MNLAPDITARLARDFGEESAGDLAKELLAAAGSNRVQRCIVFAAGGDRDRFRELCQLAQSDFRDVIFAAEYSESGVHVRSFNRAFGQEPL